MIGKLFRFLNKPFCFQKSTQKPKTTKTPPLRMVSTYAAPINTQPTEPESKQVSDLKEKSI